MARINPETSPDPYSPVISIDAMGGDRGPAAVVAGIARAARRHPGIRFVVHGDENELNRLLRKRRFLRGKFVVRHAGKTITMNAKPSYALRNGEGTSMWSAIESVRKGESHAAVSCGNTGALMAISMMRLRIAKGLNRPAIACHWPSRNRSGTNILLDVGADVRADENDLLCYAIMGSEYARSGLGLKYPRIGLLNVGKEEHKGRKEIRSAFRMISESAEEHRYEFVGFVEGGDIPSDRVDVVVTDGFTGNVTLKSVEGTAILIREFLGSAFRRSPMARVGALLAYTSLRRLWMKIDPRRGNGGVFLGLNGTVVKSHGGADAVAVAAAIELAIRLARAGISRKLGKSEKKSGVGDGKPALASA
ncbi:MAG: phosphate acyltransferase PlsX [Albidovulum sp.]|nr:phosphate acyltransferase PlsX [Albidovulum sp.]MDE0531296.1 phosphate acyltransferase PlsX [Albidovulum sp.]